MLKDTRLIQRLEAPWPGMADNPFNFGVGLRNGGLSPEAMDLLRPIFSFDYMGSAEFEHGAVPDALNRMALGTLAAGTAEFTEDSVQRAGWRGDGPLRGQRVYILSAAGVAGEVEQRIRALAKDEGAFRLKEAACFAGALRRPEGRDYPRTLGWLELDNGFMWFADREMWSKVCDLFGTAWEAVEEVRRG